jgi:NADPH-dependent 2,4-dienoyl-CoA reductase/sulfur reductase-like enzyme/nitrite reductase/ring-hydroxylating ferredoxin subunit
MAEQTNPDGPDLGNEGLPSDQLRIGEPVAGHVDGKPVVLIRTPDTIHVLGGSCTHYGGPLAQGLCSGGQIRCPWHHAAFDLETGEAMGAPALDPVPVYRVEERDGRIFATDPVRRLPSRTPPSAPESVVIVGSGAAGAAAAETLRREGYEGPIRLLGIEAPVDRPNLSKDYLAGTAPEEWIPLRSPGFYADAGIDLITAEVIAIDRSSRTVHTRNGGEYRYEALLLAPGAVPKRLPVPGAERDHVRYLRTREDAEALIGRLHPGTRTVVIGAGFIGLEVAASLRHRDLPVTVVAPEEIPLATIVGPTLGRFVSELHRSHGVDMRLGRGVGSIGADSVTLDDGSEVPADLVVVGIGVAPATRLAEEAGLTVDNGIVVDDRLRTSDPHIWAAGDAANYPGPDGSRVRVEHWVAAERQGQAAARNILGHDQPFTDPPFFWSSHYDTTIRVTGFLGGWDEEVAVGDPFQGSVLVGLRSGGRIRGVASIRRDLDSLRAEEAFAGGDDAALETLFQATQGAAV